jgi:hypothetical protein
MTFRPDPVVAFRYAFVTYLAGFVIVGLVNDLQDFLRAQRTNQPVRPCAVVSALRPPRCP